MRIYRFPANRPFRPFGDHTKGETFDRRTVFNENTNVHESKFAPISPPTMIKYHNGPFMSQGGAGNRNDINQIEVGRNWQTLVLVRGVFNDFGLGDPPASYEDITDKHIALAIFMNKMNANDGRTMRVVNPDYAPNTPESVDEPAFAVLMGHGQYVFGQLNFLMAELASSAVSITSFFQPSHIEHMVHEIASFVGGGVDKDALRDAIGNIGNQQKEQLNEHIARSFEMLVQAEAEQTYKLFSPNYDITDSPNFAQHKQALTQLMEDMFVNAVEILLFGDASKDTNHLWDSVWTDDRIFNIAGQHLTMREMEDRRTFLWSGSHRQTESEDSYAEPTTQSEMPYEDSTTPHSTPQLTLFERLSKLFAQRFGVSHNLQSVLASYEIFS